MVVVIGDDRTQPAAGIETAEIISDLQEIVKMYQVLHVPYLKYNLFSLGEVTKREF